MPDLFDISHGAGGLWEIHRWNGALDLNTQAGNNPRYFLQRITGLHSLPERNDQRAAKVARIGETAYPTNPLGKTVTYEGTLMADSVPVLRQARTALVAAFADTRAEGYMDLLPQAGDSSPAARFYAMPMQLEPPDEIAGGRGFDRSFLLGLRLSDPRIYYPSLAVDETGNPVSVTNTGDAAVDPVITVTGASGTVTVTDGTRTLAFRDVPAGDLVIDFAARTAVVADAAVTLTVADSDWWDRFVDGIAGGATVTVAQTGGTGVRVQFTPATWA